MKRVHEFLSGTLTPFPEKEETTTEKTVRLSSVMLSVAKEAAKVKIRALSPY